MMSSCAGLGRPLRGRTAVIRHRSSRLLLLPAAALRGSAPRFRCVLDQVAARLAASSPPLGSVLAAGNAIAAAAAAAGGSGASHAAVGSTLAQVAVTAVAIASGACLSTKVDFLWPKVEEKPGVVPFFLLLYFRLLSSFCCSQLRRRICRRDL